MPEIHNNNALLKNRKLLRNYSTPAEGVLWRWLKNSQLEGRKFRRQHSVGRYILDFYCPAELLAVELDGATHYTLGGSNNDFERDKNLASLNITVVRIENRRVFNNIAGVLEEIKMHFKQTE